MVDTLVNPRRRMAATEVLDITDADVQDAPAHLEIGTGFFARIADQMPQSPLLDLAIDFWNDQRDDGLWAVFLHAPELTADTSSSARPPA